MSRGLLGSFPETNEALVVLLVLVLLEPVCLGLNIVAGMVFCNIVGAQAHGAGMEFWGSGWKAMASLDDCDGMKEACSAAAADGGMVVFGRTP